MRIRIRFATTNAPESAKRGLLRDRLARAFRVGRFTERRRIDVRAIQEAGTFAEQVDHRQPRRKVLWAKFNDLVRGRRVGNGVDVARWRWKSRLLDDLTVGTGDDAVHIAVVEITHRLARWRFKFYAPHKPTRRATNADLRPVVDAVLREHTRRDDAAGIPWVIAGDMNGPLQLGVPLGDHGPDHIRGSKHFEPLGQTVVNRPRLSDHPFLIADTEVDTLEVTT